LLIAQTDVGEMPAFEVPDLGEKPALKKPAAVLMRLDDFRT
jgi:hypothetical protein